MTDAALLEAFGCDEEDLQANRQGRLTARQQQYLRETNSLGEPGGWIVVGIIGIVLFLVSISGTFGTVMGIIFIVVEVIVAALTWWWIQIKRGIMADIEVGQATSVTGPVSCKRFARRTHQTSASSIGTSSTYRTVTVLRIEVQTDPPTLLSVTQKEQDAFEEGVTYTVYYFPTTKHAVSAERVDESNVD